MAGAFETGVYRNVFLECGIPEEEIEKKVSDTFRTMFYGKEEERIYHEAGPDCGFLTDTGNNDVRTEGMSYGMMMCVQLDKKEEFDRIWKWARTYMYMDAETLAAHPEANMENEGYFAWSCQLDGTKNAWGPAPDGEEFLPWHSSSLPTAGATEKGFSIIQPRHGKSCMTASIREKNPVPESPCGIRTII